jgi:hypothetical protein
MIIMATGMRKKMPPLTVLVKNDDLDAITSVLF